MADGMRCERCGRLRQYFGPTVVLRYGRAWVEKERTPIRDEPTKRFHPECYSAAREEDPSLPPVGEKPPPKFVR
jgi:hypothetical protein